MTMKAKYSKKQQQTVATAMVTLNLFVVPDEIFSKIFTAAASSLPNMDGNSSSTSPKMGQNQPLVVLSNVVLSDRSLSIPIAKQFINPDNLKNWADQMEIESTVPPPVFGAVDGGAWKNINSHQRFSDWVASNLESLNDATKVAIIDKILLTTLKIAWSSGVASVFSPFLSVALCNVPLGIFFDNIKTAFGIFGVVTSVKLKPAGLWQYAVVNFEDISSAAALSNWSILVRKDSVRILPIANQKEVISSRDVFKAKLVNLSFGYTVFEISDLVFQVCGCTCFIPCSPESYQCQCFAVITFNSLESLNVAVSKTSTLHDCCIWWETPGCCCCYRCQDLNHLAVNCKKLPPFSLKLLFNTFGGPKNFKSSFVGSKFYAKAAAFVVSSGAAAANMDLDLGSPSKTATPMLPAVFSALNSAVKSRLASLESHLNELSVLIKPLVEFVGALITLVTKLLSTPSAMNVSVKECVNGLAKQNKGLAAVATMMQKRMTCLEKICKWVCLENRSNVDNMVNDVDDNDDDDKDFSVYNNIFDVMMHLWEDQPSRIKSSSDQTAKWMSDMVKNSYEFVSIMGKMYELDMFNILDSKNSTSV
ncbi:hypothetical protein G9A89_012783 [Geosiphon pyriformis]|nr:hypothetical protein G9A89_012783 [Geosiphon pyriformis]